MNTRVTCLLGLFVGEFEKSVKEEDRIEGMGLIDFLEEDVVEVFFGPKEFDVSGVMNTLK